MNSDVSTQQEIVSSLLAISTESSSLIAPREDKVVTCPHCHSTCIRANDKLKEVQRYLCNGCKKSFNETTTKYLHNYLNWFLVLEKIKNSTTRITTVTAIAFASNTAWMEFKNITASHIFFRI